MIKVNFKNQTSELNIEAGKPYIATPSRRTSGNRIEKSTIHLIGLSTLLFVLKYVVELIMSIVTAIA